MLLSQASADHSLQGDTAAGVLSQPKLVSCLGLCISWATSTEGP